MKLTNRCPHCKSNSLQFFQDAIISFDIVNGKPTPILNNIGYLDNSFLCCDYCGLDNSNSKDLNELHKEFLKAI